MSDFFKQIVSQLAAIWQRLSLQQKIVTTALVAFTLLGMTGLIIWSQKSIGKESGYKILYANLDVEEAAAITDELLEIMG